jgi:dTDP-4-amino-4,6-dideoxygalactose transaminase
MRIGRTLPPVTERLPLASAARAAAGLVLRLGYLRRREAEIRGHFGVRHAFLTSSGKAALTLLLQGLRRLSSRCQVVIPAYTCFSVPAAIVRAGLDVRLADVEPATLDLDPVSLEKAIGPDTLAVVVSHLFGMTGDVDRVRRACGARSIFVLEDAAQAMGVRHRGRLLGTLGDAGFFSLGRGKCVTAGHGGVVVTDDERIGAAVAGAYRDLPAPGAARQAVELAQLLLTSLFVNPALYWLPAGLPFLGLGETRFEPDFPLARLSGVAAGALHGWRDRLAASAERRGRAARAFPPEVRGAGPGSNGAPYLRMPILMASAEARDRAYRAAARRGLGVSRMYPTAVHEIPALRKHFEGQDYPLARRVAETLLALPTHRFVRDADRSEIAAIVTRR